MAGYMEYKDSGIPWLGEYPSHWECCRVKNSFFSTKTIVGEVADSYERLALTLNGVVKRSKIDAGGLQPERFETYQVLREKAYYQRVDYRCETLVVAGFCNAYYCNAGFSVF